MDFCNYCWVLNDSLGIHFTLARIFRQMGREDRWGEDWGLYEKPLS